MNQTVRALAFLAMGATLLACGRSSTPSSAPQSHEVRGCSDDKPCPDGEECIPPYVVVVCLDCEGLHRMGRCVPEARAPRP